MLHGHLLTLVLAGVQRLRHPLHKPVLRHELDPLSGPVGSCSTHAVHLLGAVAFGDIGLLQDLVSVKLLRATAQVSGCGEPSLLQG